ncbi:MAG: TIGR03435 family protein [Terracidiphilus sp.]
MHALSLLISLAFASSVAFGQAPPPAPAFEVASVKPDQRIVGLDYNNQLTYSFGRFTARNVTLKRLVAEAYRVQLSQISGPSWIDRNEYDIDARTAEGATREQMALMLRSLLASRFNLQQQSETREMRVYDLVVGNTGPKIHPIGDGETAAANSGSSFHGDMRKFADFLAVMFTMPAASSPSEPVIAGGPQIPVLDKTGLTGIYDFSVDMRPELGTDGFTSWQRILQDQLGLKIESRKENVSVMVIDEAAKVPTAN